MVSAPYGVIWAQLLPLVMQANVKAPSDRTPGSLALNRYERLTQIVADRSDAKAAEGVVEFQADEKLDDIRESAT
jgi:hypothetical protein